MANSATCNAKNYPTMVEEFRKEYDFELDEFQLDAAAAIAEGRGVLVGAPTGAGKTIVGEFAVYMAFHGGGACFYTTPIKALSNQKYHDLCASYGEENVGLLTGDVTLNPDAPIVVMTTEVLRNMIYADSDRLASLTHVVMDEVHFLADRWRGPVWEETILNLDQRVTLVSLSATVSNVEEFGGWLRTLRGETDIIVTDKRPVPLTQYMMVGSKIMRLFSKNAEHLAGEDHPGAINRSLLSAVGKAEAYGNQRGPRREDVVRHLEQAKMLPAIYFIFSRIGCDKAVQQLLIRKVELTTPDEAREIGNIIDEGVAGLEAADLHMLGFRQWRRALMRGFGAHHAGMLPAFRHIVEKLFSRGLLKVCFATETLALGINMPARTVVLEKMTKFNGEAHAELTPGQYTQLTGRAGRRGIDTVGNAVVLWSPQVDPYAVAALASARTYPLDSTFRPGYNMAVNLIATKGWTEAHRILERSFAQYQANDTIVERAHAVELRRQDFDRERAELAALVGRTEAAQRADAAELTEQVLDYAELRRTLSHEERQAKRDAALERQQEVEHLLRSINVGDVLALPTGKNPVTAVVVRSDSGRNPRPTLVLDDGWVERVAADMFRNTPVIIGHMRIHRGVERAPKRHARAVASQLRRMHLDKPKKIRPHARGGSKKAAELRNQLHVHPVHSWAEREELAKKAQSVLKAGRRWEYQKQESEQPGDSLTATFDRIIALLEELGYVETWAGEDGAPAAKVTEEGEKLARIHHESDLLVAQCLRRGLWDDLDPAELAAAVSACVFENRRESTVRTQLPTDALEEAVAHTLRVYKELASDEERHRLTATREPQLGFATAVHQWVAGAPLEYCLQAAEASGAVLTPGDFVRACGRVKDLLDQIKMTGYSNDVRKSARKAVDAMQRGVVAIDV